MTRTAFTRSEPDERRLSLIEATARVLADKGVAGVSVRAICKEAGVSPGLLTHYFDGIDALIADTYRWTSARVATQHVAAVEAAGDDPRTRLKAYVQASFRPPIADAGLLSTWIAFWSLVKSSPTIARLHGELYAGYRSDLEPLLAAAGVAADEVRLAAVALTALVDGLWLELCLGSESFTAEEAVGIADKWIDAQLPAC